MITIEDVKSLRDETGISVMECRKALEAAGGDREKAILILKKRSSEVAEKKVGRELKAGLIVVKEKSGTAAVVTLLCETDFVAKNSDFQKVANDLGDIALASGKEAAESAAKEMIAAIVQKIGENIQLGEISVISGKGNFGIYIHDGKKAAIAEIDGGNIDVAKDVAMHAVAMSPEYMRMEEVPAETKEKVSEMFKGEVDSGKPAEIQEKILTGKVASYFKERVLMEQPFVKDPDMTVGKYLSLNKANITSLHRFSV